MAFEWDEPKRERNLAKHGVDFWRILALFEGDTVEIIDTREDYGETRINCIGEIEGRVYAVSYTWRGASRRIISARRANEREKWEYYARDL
jgi:uncharacterized protein